MKSLQNWLKEKLDAKTPEKKAESIFKTPAENQDSRQQSDRPQNKGRFDNRKGSGQGGRNQDSRQQSDSPRQGRNAQRGRGNSSRPQNTAPVRQGQNPSPAIVQYKEPANGADYLRIVILGGLDEVGRNCALFETKNDMIMVDCGLMFPDVNMLGIDYVIPDVKYVEERINKFRGIIITHGHLDHIGGMRHVMPKLRFAPIYGSRMSIGLIKKNLEEYDMLKDSHLHEVTDKDMIKLGSFEIRFIKVTHSVPGSFALDIKTPFGRTIHTGDFKFDFTAPFPNDIPDFERLAQAGEEGIDFLLSDSTNATVEGYTRPEVIVAENLADIITKPQGRIIVGTVSSNIARIQNMINIAKETGREVFIAGRSMVNNVEIAKKLQYMNYSEHHVRKLDKSANDLPDHKVLIITTGSQGEEFAALNRMANDTHMQIKIKPGDTIAFSASPIPGTGNDRSVSTMINKFISRGAFIITNEDLDLHSSGHGKTEDLKMMLQLVTPKYFIPVHGELFMRLAHKNLAIGVGMRDEDVYLLQNGSIIEIGQRGTRPVVKKEILPIRNIYIDGFGGTENQDEYVLEDRKTMSKDGVAIVLFKISKDRKLIGAPKIISKGFIYLDEHAEMLGNLTAEAAKAYEKATKNEKGESEKVQNEQQPKEGQKNNRYSKRSTAHKDMRHVIRSHLARYILKKIDREPVIVPLIVEV